MGIEKEVEIWYAMRATYRREPDAMHLLKKENLGCFIPMQYKICIKKGKKVKAGTLLGTMGDTGYGKEGTHGKFAVHLHFGIYRDKKGEECSLNPYDVLLKLK